MDACFPARFLAACHLFVSDEETRYYLQGVYLEQLAEGAGMVLAATDGSIAAAAHPSQGFVRRDVILSVPDKPFLAACRKDPDLWLCIPKGELAKPAPELFVMKLTTQPTNAEFAQARNLGLDRKGKVEGTIKARTQGTIIDGTFPDFRRVFPSYGALRGGKLKDGREDRVRLSTPFLSATYLKLLADASLALTDQQSVPMRFTAGNDEGLHSASGPVLVEVGSEPRRSQAEFIAILMPMRNDAVPAERPGWFSIPSTAEAKRTMEREMSTGQQSKEAAA